MAKVYYGDREQYICSACDEYGDAHLTIFFPDLWGQLRIYCPPCWALFNTCD